MPTKPQPLARLQPARDGGERLPKRRKQQHAPGPGASPAASPPSSCSSGSGLGPEGVSTGTSTSHGAASPPAPASASASPRHLSDTPDDEPGAAADVGADTDSGAARRHSTATGGTAHTTPPAEDDSDDGKLVCEHTLPQDAQMARPGVGPAPAPPWGRLPLAVVQRILSCLGPQDQLMVDPSGLHARWQRLAQTPFPTHLPPPHAAAFAEAMADCDDAATTPAPADPEALRQHTVAASAVLLRAENMRLALAMWTLAYVRWRAILGALAQLGPVWRTAAHEHESWTTICDHFENPLIAHMMEGDLHLARMDQSLSTRAWTHLKATWHMDHTCVACLVSAGTTERMIQMAMEVDEAVMEDTGQDFQAEQGSFGAKSVSIVATPLGPVALCALHAALPSRTESQTGAAAATPGCCRSCFQSGGTDLRLAATRTYEDDEVLCYLCRFQLAYQVAAPLVQRTSQQADFVPVEHLRLAYTENRARREFVDNGVPALSEVYWSLTDDLWLTAHAAMMVTRSELLRHKQAVSIHKYQQLHAERVESAREIVRQERREAWSHARVQQMREWEREGRELSDAFLAQYALPPLVAHDGEGAKGKGRAKPIHPALAIAVVAQRNCLPLEQDRDSQTPGANDDFQDRASSDPDPPDTSSRPIGARLGLLATEPASPNTHPQSEEEVALTRRTTQYEDDEWLAVQLNLELNGVAGSDVEADDYWSNGVSDSASFLDDDPPGDEALLDSEEEEAIALEEAQIQRIRVLPILTSDDDRYIRIRSLENYCADSFQKGFWFSPQERVAQYGLSTRVTVETTLGTMTLQLPPFPRSPQLQHDMEACWWRVFDDRVRTALASLADWLRSQDNGALLRDDAGQPVERDPIDWGLEELLEKLHRPDYWLSPDSRIPPPRVPSDVYHLSTSCMERLLALWRPMGAALPLCLCTICERRRGFALPTDGVVHVTASDSAKSLGSDEIHDLVSAATL